MEGGGKRHLCGGVVVQIEVLTVRPEVVWELELVVLVLVVQHGLRGRVARERAQPLASPGESVHGCWGHVECKCLCELFYDGLHESCMCNIDKYWIPFSLF